MNPLAALVRAVRRGAARDRRVTALVALHVLVGALVATWDLGGAWGWENDGVAPRGLFEGLANTFTPGAAHRYPGLHYVWMALLGWPTLLPAALGAEGSDLASLKAAVLVPGAMTGLAIVAKAIALAMSAVTLATLARIGSRLFGRDAGPWTVVVAATCLSVAYYSRTTNLDGPILMWVVLAVDRLQRVAQHGERRDWTAAAVFAACAVAAKDQAYAAWVLTLPWVVLIAPRLWPHRFAPGARSWREAIRAALVGAGTYAVASGAAFNPTGFRARVALLTGPNSQDWRQYPKSLEGLRDHLADLAPAHLEFLWPLPMALCVWLGLALALAAPSRVAAPAPLVGADRLEGRTHAALPAIVALSSLVTFTLVVARTEHRFLLLPGALLAPYGGGLVAALVRRPGASSPRRPALRGLGVLAASVAVFTAAAPVARLAATQLGDARHSLHDVFDALPEGTTLETYSQTVAQPHFLPPAAGVPYRCARVGPKPVRRRNPLSGCDELQEPMADVAARGPDVILVPWASVRRWLSPDHAGMWRNSPRFAVSQSNTDAVTFMTALAEDRLPGYRAVADVGASLPGWADALGGPVRVHGSTGSSFRLLVRDGAAEVFEALAPLASRWAPQATAPRDGVRRPPPASGESPGPVTRP